MLPITHWTEMRSADAEHVPSSQPLVPPSEILKKVFPTVWQYLWGQQGETLEKRQSFLQNILFFLNHSHGCIQAQRGVHAVLGK